MGEMKTVSEIIEEVVPYYKKKKGPETEHKLVYDSSSETLEPTYFFILDLMKDFGLIVEKLVDNFSSSPGSGHFSEIGQKATIMQQQGTRILADINAVLRSVLNIIYDLKDFKMRFQYYDDLKSKNKNKTNAARLSLKQIWMDKVDIAKGNSSIKAMAMQGGFQTLIDAFLIAKDESLKDETGNEIDLNDRVKRILKARITEFNIWLENSEKELRKRYEIERSYLKSQVSSLKLYSRWAKPYLKTAQELEMVNREKEPALVKAFNTMVLELTLLGKSKVDIKKASLEGDLPLHIKNIRVRDYYNCVLVTFRFRGIPQRLPQGQGYVFGGRAEIVFKGYALNSDELEKVEEEFGNSDIEDMLKIIEGTTEGIEQIKDEINFFLEDKEKESSSTDDEKLKDESNPFLALIGKYNTKKKPLSSSKTEGAKKTKQTKSDTWDEKESIRPFVCEKARETAFDLFDIYKKSHGMPSYT